MVPALPSVTQHLVPPGVVRVEVCGDGVLSVGEQCDDGHTAGGDMVCYGGPNNGQACFDDIDSGTASADIALEGSSQGVDNDTTVSRNVTLTGTGSKRLFIATAALEHNSAATGSAPYTADFGAERCNRSRSQRPKGMERPYDDHSTLRLSLRLRRQRCRDRCLHPTGTRHCRDSRGCRAWAGTPVSCS